MMPRAGLRARWRAALCLSLLLAGQCVAQSPAKSSPQASTQSAGNRNVIRYGQAMSAVRSIFSLPIVIAQREGLFRREGLDFRLVIPVPGGADRMIDALHDDTVDITHVATPFLVRAALAGSDAVAIAAEFNNPIYSLVARPEIKTYADLRGKLLGLADEAGSITVSTRKLLQRQGLGSGDFQFKTIDGTPSRFNCLQKGDCIAVPLGQPQDLQAISQGYRLLGTSVDVVPEFVYTVTAVSRAWAARHKDVLQRYVRALAASFAFIRDPAKRQSVTGAIVQSTGVSEDIASRILTLYFEPERRVLPRRGEIDMKGFAEVIAFMGEAGLLKTPLPDAARFVDLQYLQAAGVAVSR
jgi:ABC-type nitrate/sulfonate/bicarbonate transport system substrate-binding protein